MLTVRISLLIICLSSYLTNSRADNTDGLEQLSIEELMNSKVVSVTRTEQQLTDTAAAAYVITQDDIRRSGATTIPEALRMVPGLQVARISATRWAISARGFNGLVADKLLVLMDGRSLYSPIHKGVYWDVQDRVLDDIERIEVIRGPGASVWGANAVNGVINIITKHTVDTEESDITVFGGDKYGAALRQGWKLNEQSQARVYGKFLRDDSFVNRIGHDAQEEWTSGRGGFRVDWANAEGKHALMLQGDMFYGQYDENNIKYQLLTSQQLQQLNTFVLNRVEKQGGNLLAKWNYNQSLASHMVAQFFYDTLHAQEDLTSPNILQSEIIDIDFQHILALNAAHEFTWGLNYRLSLVELTPLNEFFQREYRPGTFENNRLSIFLQDKWRVHDDVELTLGSKFEHHTNNDFEYEPSLRLLWQAAKQHRLWTGISRAVRLPAVTDYQAKDSFDADIQVFTFNQNKTLTSDEVISYELGYRYWNTDVFSIDIAAYYNQYHNSLVADIQFFKWFPERSIKKSSSLGLETALVWRPVDKVRLQLSTSLMEMDIQSKRKIKNLIINTTSRDPSFLYAFRSSFDITSQIEMDWWLRYTSSASGIFTTQAIPSYVTLDMRLAWQPIKQLELAFIANNLNNAHHAEFYDAIAPNPLHVERMFWLQAHVKF